MKRIQEKYNKQLQLREIFGWLPNQCLLVQSQQWNYQNNMSNIFKVNNNDTFFLVNFWLVSHIVLVFLLLNLNK